MSTFLFGLLCSFGAFIINTGYGHVIRADGRSYDPAEYITQVRREIQRSAGFDDATMQKYLRTLRQMNRIGETMHLGSITGADPPQVLPVTSDDLVSPGAAQFFEGDIILSSKQMDEVVESALDVARIPDTVADQILHDDYDREKRSDTHMRRKRKLDSNTSERWRMPIQYKIADGSDFPAVEAGIREWEDNTCVRFQRVNQPSATNYVEFVRGSGCYANVGMVGGKQEISIGWGCSKIGTVAHEIGHTLGFWHEQSRPDRDDHVRIMSRNILPGMHGNFVPRSHDSVLTDIPYDLGSVMHYGSTAFANSPGLNTIESLNRNHQRTMGQREGLSFYDIKYVNVHYNCIDACPRKLPCEHGGYTDPKDCTRCKCPTGLGGLYCETAGQTTSNCGSRELTATSQWQTVSQTGEAECNWMITTGFGRKMRLEITTLRTGYQSVTCTDRFVEIKHENDIGNTGPRLCTDDKQGTSFETEGSVAVIRYIGFFGTRFSMRYRYEGGAVIQPTTTTWRPTTTTTRRPITTTTRKPITTTPFVPLTWSEWTRWGGCPTSCGGCGRQSRARFCFTPPCSGKDTEYKDCNMQPCPGSMKCCYPRQLTSVNQCGFLPTTTTTTTRPPPPQPTWSNWTPWSDCMGKLCGGCGVMKRNRLCIADKCEGPNEQKRACGFAPCTSDCVVGPIIGWGACPGDATKNCPIRAKPTGSSCGNTCCDPFELKGVLCA